MEEGTLMFEVRVGLDDDIAEAVAQVKDAGGGRVILAPGYRRFRQQLEVFDGLQIVMEQPQ